MKDEIKNGWFSMRALLSPVIKLIARLSLVILLLPFFYALVFRPIDYYLCPSIINMKLGRGFSPNLFPYVQDSLSPGMTREEVVSKLDEVGRVKVSYQGVLNGLWLYQMNLQICADPFNRIIVFTGFGGDGELKSIKFDSD